MGKRIICLVTNDLNQDQRMQRICGSLDAFGYTVTLVGRERKNSLAVPSFPFNTVRIRCWFNKSVLFYAEYNFRLFVKLMKLSFEVVNAIDLDTLPAARLASLIKRKKLVFDAHEAFSMVPELRNKPHRANFWNWLGKSLLNGSEHNYTVNHSLRLFLATEYKVPFDVFYNYPIYKKSHRKPILPSRPLKLLYQGVVNKGRGLKPLLYVLKELEGIHLTIIGTGDIDDEISALISALKLDPIVDLKGFVMPEELHQHTINYDLGLNLLDIESKSHYYSSANKFFDYVMAGLPSISMAFPEYERFNEMYKVSLLLPKCSHQSIKNALLQIKNDKELYLQLANNCLIMREQIQWGKEEKRLIEFYGNLF